MNPSFLRRILLADAATSAVTGVLLLAELLALPADLLRFSGVVLLPFAALVAILATRKHLSRRAVQAVIAANALWAVDSVLLLVSGWVEPAALGVAFVIGQALVVALFAEAEYVGLRRAEAAYPA